MTENEVQTLPSEDVVSQDASGQRIDRYLSEQLDISRTQIQQWIEAGLISINGKTVDQASKKVWEGDVVAATPREPRELQLEPEDIPLDILFEDEEIVVVNKAQGMVVHPAPGHERGTLVSALLFHVRGLSGIGGAMRPGIVHRIDKDTSGLLVVAKTDRAHQALSEQMKSHEVQRVYDAIIHGKPESASGTIDAPIGRDPHNRKKMAVIYRGGKRAVTHFRILETFRSFTRVECRLETGRTHQIRVHMAAMHCPVAGDPLYARSNPLHLRGQALHAKSLAFTHPVSRQQLVFHANPPAYYEETLAVLRQMTP
ncbi:RluA family pseudouridine synthase [Ferroacidibacillus organovorans]|uniref:RluA family pseudouridine synthase n=1 Tax=Ferroacidibacillus organovorans TaxID=1765683 RepID=UPI000AF7A176|nr:RluA family pseudouridine synthase [Ferroacidibacillus organovorans]